MRHLLGLGDFGPALGEAAVSLLRDIHSTRVPLRQRPETGHHFLPAQLGPTKSASLESLGRPLPQQVVRGRAGVRDGERVVQIRDVGGEEFRAAVRLQRQVSPTGAQRHCPGNVRRQMLSGVIGHPVQHEAVSAGVFVGGDDGTSKQRLRGRRRQQHQASVSAPRLG